MKLSRLGKDPSPWILFGVTLGILLTAAAIQLADNRVCPKNTCINEAKIMPLFNRGYFPPVHKTLQEAEKTIYILAFELKYYDRYPDSKENTFINDIIDAKNRGVDITIILDEYSKKNNAYDILKENGINIIYDSEGTTTHAKLLIVDGRVVILGSTNFSYYGLEKNNEANVLIESEEITKQYEAYFNAIWDGLLKNAA